MTKYVK